LVRKKAVIVLHSCWKLQKQSLDGVMDRVRKALCDKHPSVMAASLIMFSDMIQELGRDRYMDLIPSFVSILKQVIEHRLPSGYDYHRLPAPWIQIQILQILTNLARNHKEASERIYEILLQTMKRADSGITIGYAVIYECIRTAALIYPNPKVLAQAAATISQYISNTNYNLKSVG
jgi:AP-4 complex subunit epsilon-1